MPTLDVKIVHDFVNWHCLWHALDLMDNLTTINLENKNKNIQSDADQVAVT